MFLSIPYEKGWSVYIDGKKADTFKVLHSMLGVEVSEGNHDIVACFIVRGQGSVVEGDVVGIVVVDERIAVPVENLAALRLDFNGAAVGAGRRGHGIIVLTGDLQVQQPSDVDQSDHYVKDGNRPDADDVISFSHCSSFSSVGSLSREPCP